MTSKRKICKAPNCSRPARTKGYCSRHYYQVHKYGRLTPGREKMRSPEECVAEGCSNPPVAKGYCFRHYTQVQRWGRLTPEREHIYGRVGCIVEGCKEKKHYARGYCKKHYGQWRYAQRKATHDKQA